MSRACSLQQLREIEGEHLGASDWHRVTPEMVQLFAQATGDHQWIHLDAARAAAGPFGAPVAHGYLILAMVPRLISEILRVEGADLTVNKGLGRLRFAAPVPVGSRVRAAARLGSVRARPRRFWEVLFELSVEVEGAGTPAMTAEPTFLYRQA